MKHVAGIFVLGSLVAFFSGCSTFKPATDSPRYFLLGSAHTPEGGRVTNVTHTPLESSQKSSEKPGPIFGVAPIKFPDYLTKKSLARRKSANEIEYLESALWAERLDEGFLRVLTADLAGQLPGHTIRRTTSGKADLELQLTILQFDFNATGEAVLKADWRIVTPANGKTIDEGQFHSSREVPDPKRDPGGAVSTLSALIEDLGRALTKAIR